MTEFTPQNRLDSDTEGRIWGVSTKVRGVGELIKQQEPSSLFSSDGAYGIGSILIDLADELDAIKEPERQEPVPSPAS